MILSVECVQCEADFELELSDLAQDPTLVSCPNCGSKADPDVVEATVSSLDETLAMLGRLSRKFRVGLHVETDEVEPEDEEPYDEQDSLWANEVDEESEED